MKVHIFDDLEIGKNALTPHLKVLLDGEDISTRYHITGADDEANIVTYFEDVTISEKEVCLSGNVEILLKDDAPNHIRKLWKSRKNADNIKLQYC